MYFRQTMFIKVAKLFLNTKAKKEFAMLVKFTGFKVPPYRDHIIVEVSNKYLKVGVDEQIEVKPEDGYRLLATGNFVEIQAAPTTTRAKVNVEKPTQNFAAMLGDKSE